MEKASSHIKIREAGDGFSWWVGGYVDIVSEAKLAGVEAELVHHGDILARAKIDANNRATFFTNEPIIPIGYSLYWCVDVAAPGLSTATVKTGMGPVVPQSGVKETAFYRIPVGIVSQSWVPINLPKRTEILGANNELLVTIGSGCSLQFWH